MRVHHIALRTRDVEALATFYGSTLGLDVVRRAEGGASVWLDAGGTLLMIERAGAAEPEIPPGTLELVAFAVEDREAWRRRLEAAAVAVESETAFTLYFRDPDGRRVAVSTYDPRATAPPGRP